MKPSLHTKLFDLLRDSRLPHAIPFQWLRAQVRKRKIQATSKTKRPHVKFSFTIDVEQDYGSSWHRHHPQRSFGNLNEFYETFSRWTQEEDIKATLFVQGDSIQSHAQILKTFQDQGHEIALHGYHHELWGKPKWFSQEKVLPLCQQEETLLKALKEFKKAGLHPPVSFRAPNLVIRSGTYRALQNVGIRYDSSPSVFTGIPPLPQMKHGVKILPLTINPLPRFQWRYGLPFSSFWVFNMTNLWKSPLSEIQESLENAVQFQQANHVPPHLIFLIHSWEFHRDSQGNRVNGLSKINELFNQLQKVFELEILPFHHLSQEVHESI